MCLSILNKSNCPPKAKHFVKSFMVNNAVYDWSPLLFYQPIQLSVVFQTSYVAKSTRAFVNHVITKTFTRMFVCLRGWHLWLDRIFFILYQCQCSLVFSLHLQSVSASTWVSFPFLPNLFALTTCPHFKFSKKKFSSKARVWDYDEKTLNCWHWILNDVSKQEKFSTCMRLIEWFYLGAAAVIYKNWELSVATQ